MKLKFSQWYEANFVELMRKLKAKGIGAETIQALYPALEISALKHFDGKGLTKLQKLKWVYALLGKKSETYKISNKSVEYDVILWPSQPKHYTLQLPVYHQLKKLNIKVAFVSNTSSLQEDFKRDKVEFIEIITRKVFKNRINLFFQNLKITKQAADYPKFDTGKHQISFESIVNDTLTYREPCDKSAAIYDLILEQHKPQMIFLGYCFSTVALIIDKKCRKDSIITGTLQMGRLNYYFFKYSSLDVYYGYGQDVSKNIAQTSSGVDCVKVGSLKMEVTMQSPGKNEVQALVDKIHQTHKFLGLIAFSGPGLAVSFKGHEENLNIVKEAIAAHPEVYFVIKFHGKDRLHYYSEIKQLANVYIIDQNHPIFKFDIMHLIKLCDFLVSGASTTLMEASYWYKPAVSVDVLGELKTIELATEDFIYKCNSLPILNQSIDSILEKDATNQHKMELMKEYSDRSFTKSEQQPSELVALDVQKRIA
jgi:hypothetical protein